jgi:hypothetical protein
VRSKDGAPQQASLGQTQSALSSVNYETLLDRVAHRAMVLTRASAAAIGLRQRQAVLCRARCGELSPPLGSRVNLASGISGECLRTGKALNCGDSETDDRVDAWVCRELGIRSIAAVPISEKAKVAGILEVFSGTPNVFGDAQLKILAMLADLVAEISTKASHATVAAVVPGEVRPETPEALSIRIAAPVRTSKPWLSILRFRSPGSYSLAAAGISLLACLVAVLVPHSMGVHKVSSNQSTQQRLPSEKESLSQARRQPNQADFDMPLESRRATGSGLSKLTECGFSMASINPLDRRCHLATRPTNRSSGGRTRAQHRRSGF